MVNASSCTVDQLWMHLGDVFERTANKLTTTWGIVYWRHQRAQWEYVARLCFLKTHWIWLGQYSSYVIMYVWWCSCSIDMWTDTFLLRKREKMKYQLFGLQGFFVHLYIHIYLFFLGWTLFATLCLDPWMFHDISFHERMYWTREKIEVWYNWKCSRKARGGHSHYAWIKFPVPQLESLLWQTG